ncbi:MAG: hypothetical protein CBC24_03780 [Candidatus Pelagibacter sp. TMED64]|nr:hypothetical protein [Candidatus Pelagibacter sp.]OUU66213.1 MAG: hypothetical protein CBC24_03780 [Candidatus Pelagibacter sp. TMED64]|tara:strand:- start:799 stop:2859 length:2061 start_codon:yes stop_codon:yes gene_type:complete
MNNNITPKKISAVIPSNDNRRIESTINSIKDYVDEILIINSDNKNKISNKDDKIKLIDAKKGTNAARARNIGAELARSELILFVDADVEINENGKLALKEIKNKIIENKIYSGIYDVNNKVSFTANFLTNLLKYRLLILNKKDIKLASSSHFVIYKNFFKQVGGFNENLNSYEDVDFFTRAQKVFDANVNIEKNFTALHNKQYNIFSLIKETFNRTFNFTKTRLSFINFFRDVPSLVDWRINLAPLLLLSSFLVGLFFNSSLLFLMSFFSTILIASFFNLKIFENLKKSFFSTVVLSIVGMVSYFSIATSLVSLFINNTFNYFIKLKDLSICFIKIVFKYGKPIQLIQYITGRCNLRCDHCFYKDTLNKPDPGELDPKILIDAAKQSGPLLWYSLAGGEPFIRKDFSDIVLGVKKEAKPVVISLPTNGWYTNKTYLSCLKVMQNLKDGLFVVFISIDGPEETHDRIRGKNSFQKLRKTFEVLKKLGKLYEKLHVNIVITVQDYNYKFFPGTINSLYEEFNPTSISINLFRHHTLNGPKVKDEIIQGYEAAINEYDKIRTKKSYGLLSNLILKAKEKVQKDLILTVAKEEKFVTPCTAGNLSYVSMEDGSLKPCEILQDNLGNINDPKISVSEIFKSKQAKDLRTKIKDTKCKCTFECAMSTNVLFNKDMFPSIIKQSVKDIIKTKN